MSNSFRQYVNVLGIKVPLNNMELAVTRILSALDDKSEGRYVCVTGVHGIMESQRSEAVMKAHRSAWMCVPDGVPLVWLGRSAGFKEMGRVYGPDLMLRLLKEISEKGHSSYFYGGNEGVAEDLAERMKKRFPGLKVAGTFCPPFRPLNKEEETDIINRINEADPDIIWIGLSTPKQDLLMSKWSGKINAKLMVGVGAAFDFHTDRLKQAPAWIQKIGMEWFFRMCVEPRRLASRYLRNNPAFIARLLLQKTGLKKYPLE